MIGFIDIFLVDDSDVNYIMYNHVKMPSNLQYRFTGKQTQDRVQTNYLKSLFLIQFYSHGKRFLWKIDSNWFTFACQNTHCSKNKPTINIICLQCVITKVFKDNCWVAKLHCTVQIIVMQGKNNRWMVNQSILTCSYLVIAYILYTCANCCSWFC